MEDGKTVVFDGGSGMCKAGFAGGVAPDVVFRSVVGWPRHSGVMVGMGQPHPYFGDEIETRGISNLLCLTYPIQQGGIVHSFDAMENILHHTFYNRLRVAPEEHPTMLTEPLMNPIANREKITQIMFETFDCPSMCLCSPSMASLYASNRTSGVVVDCGYNHCTVIPIHEGTIIRQAIERLPFGGCDITRHLGNLIKERGHTFPIREDVLRNIKEKHCYIALDYDEQLQSSSTRRSAELSYNLPDGETVTMDTERFRCPEVLFQPPQMNAGCGGIHKATFKSIKKVNVNIRETMFSNVVLCGGTSLFMGMADRFLKEINCLVPSTTKVKLHASPDRKFSSWIAASLLASLPTFQDISIKKHEYEEHGPSIVLRKCV